MNAVMRLIKLFNETDPGEIDYKISAIILKNLNLSRKNSISEMAELCYTSTATMSRFAKKLGYNNYSDFRNNLLSTIEHYPHINRKMPFLELADGERYTHQYLTLFREKLSEIEEIVSKEKIHAIHHEIFKSKKISLYSFLSEEFPALELISFQMDLIMSGKEAVYFYDVEKQFSDIRTLDSDCMVIAVIPNTQEASVSIKVLENVKRAGAKLLIVTSGVMKTQKKYADFLMGFTGTQSEMDGYLLNILLNILIITYRNLHID